MKPGPSIDGSIPRSRCRRRRSDGSLPWQQLLNDARERSRWSREEVATRANAAAAKLYGESVRPMDGMRVKEIDTRLLSPPPPEELLPLVAVLGVPLDTLLGALGYQPPEWQQAVAELRDEGVRARCQEAVSL